jgi:hypothetical protein
MEQIAAIGLDLAKRIFQIQHGAVEALADAVGLRALGLGAGVIDVLDRQIEFVLVAFAAAILGASIGQHAAETDLMLVIERHDPVVEQFGCGDRRLAVVELGKGDLGVGVDEGLLIDPPDALQRADIEGVLRAAIARAFALELAMASLSALAFSSAGICASEVSQSRAVILRALKAPCNSHRTRVKSGSHLRDAHGSDQQELLRSARRHGRGAAPRQRAARNRLFGARSGCARPALERAHRCA